MAKNKKKIAIWQIFSAILFLVAVAWNIRVGGIYNLEIAIGALVLAIIKIWGDFLS